MPLSIVSFEPSNARLGSSLSELGQAQAYVLAGGALLGALIAWIETDAWSVGEYNHWMRTTDDTIAEWDKLGWSSGCWARDPAARRSWLAFWERFSKHYKTHGQIQSWSYVSDSEEAPARDLLKKLLEWEKWFAVNCGGTADAASPSASPAPTEPPDEPTDWGTLAKWGVAGVVGIVLIGVINAARGR